MATYLVVPDDYAGWNGAGRNFGYFGLAAGVVALLSEAAIRGYLGRLQPSTSADLLFLAILVWVSCGLFLLMGFCVLGSLMLSSNSRGTVSVTENGVDRVIGKRSQSLTWNEIEGFVPRPYGGVTLVAAPGKPRIIIPRFLDDYRACIAELKDRGLHSLPPSALKVKSKWWQFATNFVLIFSYSTAINQRSSHAERIVFLSAGIALATWVLHRDTTSLEERNASLWIGILMILAAHIWIILHMAHTW
jgi:hypothetical protein